MDKKSRIFFIIFSIIILAVTGASFYKFFIFKNYYTIVQAPCDPRYQKCFTITCDPAQDDTCPAEEQQRLSYYKLIEKKAYNIPSCDPDQSGCLALDCSPSDDCTEIFCDENTTEMGVSCTGPNQVK